MLWLGKYEGALIDMGRRALSNCLAALVVGR